MPRSAAAQRVLTVQELADYLHISPTTVYRMLWRRRLLGFKVGRVWCFDAEVIDRWRVEQESRRLKIGRCTENP